MRNCIGDIRHECHYACLSEEANSKDPFCRHLSGHQPIEVRLMKSSRQREASRRQAKLEKDEGQSASPCQSLVVCITS